MDRPQTFVPENVVLLLRRGQHRAVGGTPRPSLAALGTGVAAEGGGGVVLHHGEGGGGEAPEGGRGLEVAPLPRHGAGAHGEGRAAVGEEVIKNNSNLTYAACL